MYCGTISVEHGLLSSVIATAAALQIRGFSQTVTEEQQAAGCYTHRHTSYEQTKTRRSDGRKRSTPKKLIFKDDTQDENEKSGLHQFSILGSYLSTTQTPHKPEHENDEEEEGSLVIEEDHVDEEQASEELTKSEMFGLQSSFQRQKTRTTDKMEDFSRSKSMNI